jgi:hypothetical protein
MGTSALRWWWMDCTESDRCRRLGEGVFGRINRGAGASHLGVSRWRWGGVLRATKRRSVSWVDRNRDMACGISGGRMVVVVVAQGAAGGADVGGQVLVVDE